ncbi:MAG: LysR family transcriptional regulator [Oscillospiraceae bacterium]
MNTLFFKYALEVKKTASITQAAENLFMAQPNLSKAIKEIEDTLGFAIFERKSTGVTPTAKGAQFLDYARNIVQNLDKIEAIGESGEEEVQKFSLAMPRGSYIATAITNFVSELNQAKGIDLNILETNSLQTINNVAEGKFNLGIIRYQMVYEQYFKDFLKEKQLRSDTIWEFEYLALMSRAHSLADVQEIKPSDLEQSIEIIHGDTIIPYLSQEKNKAQKASAVKKRITLYERGNQFELLSHIPTTFMWVSPIPAEMLARFELVQRKCRFQGNKYKDMLIYMQDYSFSQLDKRFIDRLYEAKNEVSFQNYS